MSTQAAGPGIPRRMICLAAAVLLALSVWAVFQPKPGHAAVSLCPEPVNAYLTPASQLRDDLDLCRWPTTSSYGNFAPQQTTIVSYPTCAAWADAYRSWNPDALTPGPLPGMVGLTMNGTWTTEPTASLGRDPAFRGSFLVRIAFKPTAGTAKIVLSSPTWPGITASQQQRIKEYLAVTFSHEQGHQNLAGHAIKIFEEVVSVPAKNEKAAVNLVKTDPDFAPRALADATAANKAVQEVYERITSHGQHQSALSGTDLPSNDICGPIDLSRNRLEAHPTTSFIPCQPDPWTTQFPFPSLLKKVDSFEESTYGPPQVYQAQDATSTSLGATAGPECQAQVSNSTVDVPGSPALSGEIRTVSKRVQADSMIANPFTGEVRAMHSEASATASGKYVDELGRLTLSGNISGSAAASDTVPPINPDQRLKPGCGAFVAYDFTVVGTTSTFSLQIQGQWSSASNISATLTAVGQGWVDVYGPSGAVTLPGSTSTRALLPGKYEFRISQVCLRSGLSSTGGYTYAPLDLNYSLKIEN